MTNHNFLVVGKIVNTQGIKGEVRVIANTDFPENRFRQNNRLYVDFKGQQVAVTIEKVRQQKNFQILKFKEYQDINAVEVFKGCNLLIAAEDRPKDELAEDEFYYHDIIGLTVIDQETAAVYGTVKEIMDLGPNDVWVIGTPDYKEILMPYLKSVVQRIDLTEKKAYVLVPEGLIDED